MKTFNILLSSINDIKAFVNIVNKYEFDVDLTSGRYVVDAKSIMGIFSLDLSKVIKVDIHSDGADADKFVEEIKAYLKVRFGADIFERGLCLPSDNKMTAEEQQMVIETVKKCFE